MKKTFKIVLLLVILLCLVSCKKKEELPPSSQVKPDMNIMTGDYKLDFIEIYNNVIEQMHLYQEFFFVKNNQFDISGDNKNKTIKIEFTCLNGTTAHDANLLISLILNVIATNAAEQDFRFKAPIQDSSATYVDFGTVFDTFALSIFVKDEANNEIVNINLKPGDKIPIEPRFWSE